ncbi:glycosyltransferase family 2 protein [Geoalkalibacter halelectricus]|uniref:Glycosyltransferase family 2 protein n=1 Tax=Geoalkalibacter halelectricus TaxID=2847045 RepID=A0ABY5ZR01_9BACT|nr:glycosyltransferase family 2 protein [Geoalkalibacter halelectricus]MDO3377969.1 glycosyltransferase family 2 protein [Geoalkalibacter halelectricus]UWZ81528.1 glycosyltransferase family 2 protein [Geoalkalibacter halelectricus]
MKQPAVTVVICNFNKREDVVRAVQSVHDSHNVQCTTLVIDNASTDGSQDLLRERFGDRIQLVELPCNIGGAGGFGTGMTRALAEPSEFVLLLDNDAFLEPDALAQMCDFLVQRPDVAVVGPAILFDQQRDLVQELGGRINERFVFHPNFRGSARTELPAAPYCCDYVPACCLLTRREVIDQVGVFDPSYFLYWDDVDWCSRVRQQTGMTIQGLPSAIAWHRGGSATNPIARYYQWRNRLKYFSAHLQPAQWPAFAVSFAEQVMMALVNSRLSGKENVVAAIEAALEDATARRFDRCQNTERFIAVKPRQPYTAKASAVVHECGHVFDAIGLQGVDYIQDAYGNRIGSLAATEAAALAKNCCDYARLIAASLATLAPCD